ncbi:GntR family transcriptional regulator [uncultured Desulfosarcina sp.]|uniref:GntR family transcriptional regulator n=1 Tax=uncultured Desulfosarcina sp. TaxID=218289 RepID=UPI0029C8DE50|nr:GntR family transcriptional regulator [uncultured Desulfosarcina sp.]
MKKSLRDEIYQKIRGNITHGLLSPGERLIENRLAKEFNASRSPVREALRLLESEGLIKFEQNKGITVSKLSIKQVEEIYVVRWLLEGHAARITAEKATKNNVAYLKDLQKKLYLAAKNVDVKAWLTSNALFHNFFSQNCGNQKIIQMVDNLKRNVNRYHFVTITVPWHFETYLEQHDKMLTACEQNDGEMAEKYMKLHLQHIKDGLIKQLQERGVTF